MKWIYTLVLGITAAFCTAQCDITDLTATIGACNADGEFSITLKFFDTDIDSKAYIVQGNGINYGTLMYNNGIIIDGLLGDCTTPFEFVVRDANNPGCGEAIEVGIVCCGPCILEAKISDVSMCDSNGEYQVSFDIDNPPTNSTAYTVQFNGSNVGSLQYNGPNQTLNIVHDGLDAAEFIICDSTNTTCCDTVVITSPCVCSIFDARWDVVDCDDQDSTFSFVINAQYQVVSDSFTVAVAGVNYGNFSYSQLPIVIGPINWQPIKYDFVIADVNNLLCFDFGEPGEIELCPPACDWSNTTINYTCNADKDLEVAISIDNEGIGVLGYDVSIDGTVLDTLHGIDTTYVVTIPGGFCNGAATLELNDLYFSCDTAITLLDTCCRVPCDITAFDVGVDCSVDIMTVSLNTNAAPTDTFVSTLFFGNSSQIVATGVVSDFPLQIDISAFQNDVYVLDISIEGNLCTAEVQFEIDCPFACNLGSVAISSMGCNSNGFALVEFDFTSSDTPGGTFDVEDINGNNYGPFNYNAGPYLLEVPEDCSIAPIFYIEDSVDPTCGTTVTLPDPLCCTCEIEFTSIDLADCMDGSFEVTLEISTNNAASDWFELAGNGNNYGTFMYSASPITLTLLGDCTTIYEFVATDSQSATCIADIALDEPVCCEVPACLVEITSFVIAPCNGMMAGVTLEVSGTMVSDSFGVAGNGINYGVFAYNQSPITIDVLGDCSTIYEFEVTDQADSDCSDAIDLGAPICCQGACSINITSLNVSPCDGDSAVISLTFASTGMASDSFTLQGNGNNYGQYAYNGGTVDITVAGDCTTIYEFVATDQSDNTCTVDTVLLEPICCDIQACSIEIANVEIGECEDGLVDVVVIVNAGTMTSDSFTLRGNGIVYGSYGYNQSPIVLTIEPDCELDYEFIAIDSEDADCRFGFELTEALCCDSMTCAIEITDLSIGDCDGDSITVRLDVFYESSTSTSFAVVGNGVDYGLFDQDQDVEITFAADCSTIYEFEVLDVADPMCSDFVELEEPLCCDSTSCELEVVDLVVGECENGVYSITFSVEGTGLSTTLVLSQDSVVVDALLTADDTYTLGPIEANDTLTYTVSDPVAGCSDSFTVSQDCLTDTDETLLPETAIYAIDDKIVWQSENTWWTDVYVYTIDGQPLAQLNNAASHLIVSQSGIYIVELRSARQRMVEKVLVVR